MHPNTRHVLFITTFALMTGPCDGIYLRGLVAIVTPDGVTIWYGGGTWVIMPAY